MENFKKITFFSFLFFISSMTICPQFSQSSFQKRLWKRQSKFEDNREEERLKLSKSLSERSRRSFLNQCKIIGVHFSPEAYTAERLIELINKAKNKICIAIYWFTDKKIAEALIYAKNERNVDIQIVTDQSCLKVESEKISLLYENEIPIFVWVGQSIMHNKFALFDENIVWTGSYNWTVKADKRNRENVIVIENFDIHEKYKEELEIIKSKSFSFEIYQKISRRIVNVSSDLNLSGLGITSQQLENLILYFEGKGINKRLRHLDLSHNNIVYFNEKFPNFSEGDDSLEFLGSFKKLKYLDLSYNYLEFIPYTFKSLNSIIFLNLKANPLRKEMGVLKFLPKITTRGGTLLID